MRISRLLLFAALPLAGCGITDSDSGDRPLPAIIEMGSPTAPEVVVPTEVRAGELFTVQVTTYGGGCTTKSHTESVAQERVVDVYPFDFFPADENTACTRELRTFHHQVEVRLELPGTATVRVHGRRMTDFEPVVVTRSVTVTQ